MLKLLKTIMRAGTATVKYPFAPLEVSPGFRGKPDLMPSQCIACGACACACPANALTIQTDDQQNSRTWQMTRRRRGRRVAFNSFICWMKLCRNRPSI